MRRPLIAGNWKLNSNSAHARALAADVASAATDLPADLVLFPSYTLLADVFDVIEASHVALGAQNVATQTQGAFTGEVSASMLREVGCSYAIIGHSERRSLFSESDVDIADKVVRCLAEGLTPVLCVGESLGARDGGRATEVVRSQLHGALASVENSDLSACVVAYEPVWAIGTGRSASPEQAQEVHASIRAWLATRDEAAAHAVRLLYGGSVKVENAGALLAQTDIDGALVGGASLVADSFLAIAQAAAG